MNLTNQSQIIRNYDDSIEKSILSCILIKPVLLEEIYLEAKHFVKYHKCFQLFFNFYTSHKHLNLTLLACEAEKLGMTQDKFIDFYLEIANIEPTTIGFNDFMDKQLEIYTEYSIMILSEQLQNKEIELDDYLKRVLELSKKNTHIDYSLSEEEIYDLITTDKKIINFNKFSKLGRVVKFQEKTFNVIAARPGIGKSSFALNLFEDLSQNYKCLYFNMEISEKEMYERLVAINVNTKINLMLKPTEYLKKNIKESIHEIKSRKIKIINGSKNIDSMKNIIIKEQRDEHLIVFIDYIGYITNPKSKSSEREKLAEIIRTLTQICMDYNVTIFCLAQINREGNDTPTKENLKDTGELEQSGHSVILLHNESVDPINSLEPLMKIIIAKNRSGKTGYIEMKFLKESQVFKELEVKQ